MADEGYISSTSGATSTPAAWENSDQSDFQNGAVGRQHGIQLRGSTFVEPAGSLSPSPTPGRPEELPSNPRTSLDSVGRSLSTKWQDNPSGMMISEHREMLPTVLHDSAPTLVEPTFDESVLRALCELDCGVPLLLDRIKQSATSCKEASLFFKKRAAMEEEYGKNIQKLARTTAEAYATSDGKAGTFVQAWQATMRVHELMAENRLRFAQRLLEMSEELAVLTKEVDKNRKQTKELALRYERALSESEAVTEKSKNRLDITSEELERVLLQKEGEPLKDNAVQVRPGGAGGKRAIGKAVAKGGLLLKGKNPGNIQRQEDDIRSRMSAASDVYRKAVTDTQAMRQEYFNFQLPRILRSLKECTDEMDLGTQYHLTRYSFLFESIILSDGSILVPAREEGLGLKASIETIDNRGDFRTYMQNYAYAHGGMARGPRREGPSEEGFLPPLPRHDDKAAGPSGVPNGVNGHGGPSSSSGHSAHERGGRPTFGVGLAEQMTRDNVELPLIMVKCCQAIEKYGMETQGIYRISGTTSKVAKLRQKLDQDLDSVELDAPEWSSDINNVTSVLKQWLRDLPDPLLTYSLHQGFMDAAKNEHDRLRHIRLHERVNDLPDPNYATLKFFLGHLHRIIQNSAMNLMTAPNLAIVFGPTLFGQVAAPGAGMADTALQNLAIETILNHYNDIFVDESEGPS